MAWPLLCVSLSWSRSTRPSHMVLLLALEQSPCLETHGFLQAKRCSKAACIRTSSSISTRKSYRGKSHPFVRPRTHVLHAHSPVPSLTSSSNRQWLHSTFLYQRIQQNPRHYALGKSDGQTWQDRLDALVLEAVQGLQKRELVECNDSSGSLVATSFGETMSKVCSMTIREVLSKVCSFIYDKRP
jgi:hypothetical protein